MMPLDPKTKIDLMAHELAHDSNTTNKPSLLTHLFFGTYHYIVQLTAPHLATLAQVAATVSNHDCQLYEQHHFK